MPAAIIPLITTGISLLSSANQKAQAKRAEKQAEESLNNAPKYKPNQSILDYYSKALQRYNTSPTDTAQYKMDKQNIGQSTVQALASLNKLRSGDVASIIQGKNNSLLKAAVNAENRKAQEFNVLGNATNMKAGQDVKAFQQNELYPFEGKYNLMTMKAAGNRAASRQSLQNAYNNASSAVGVLAGGDNDWGTGRNMWGQQTRTVMGKTFTKPQYNKVNNAWGANRSNYAAY